MGTHEGCATHTLDLDCALTISPLGQSLEQAVPCPARTGPATWGTCLVTPEPRGQEPAQLRRSDWGWPREAPAHAPPCFLLRRLEEWSHPGSPGFSWPAASKPWRPFKPHRHYQQPLQVDVFVLLVVSSMLRRSKEMNLHAGGGCDPKTSHSG